MKKAYIYCGLPDTVALSFSRIRLDPAVMREPTGEYHCTICCLGEKDTVSDAEIEKAKELLSQLATKPIWIRVTSFGTLPPHPVKNTVPVVCPVISTDLHELHDNLLASFDKEGVSYSKTFPVYKPHVTLGYYNADQKVEQFESPLSPTAWAATRIYLKTTDLETGEEQVTTFRIVPRSTSNEGIVARYLQSKR